MKSELGNDVHAEIYSIFCSTGNDTTITFYPTLFSRYAIQLFGNGNGFNYIGTLLIEDPQYGYIDESVLFINGQATAIPTTYNEQDGSITVDGLAKWSNITLLSPYPLHK